MVMGVCKTKALPPVCVKPPGSSRVLPGHHGEKPWHWFISSGVVDRLCLLHLKLKTCPLLPQASHSIPWTEPGFALTQLAQPTTPAACALQLQVREGQHRKLWLRWVAISTQSLCF